MKHSIAKKWVEALRSGKYKQGFGQLYNPSENSYCCLGVLADVQGTVKKQEDNCYLNGHTSKWAELSVVTEPLLSRENDTERSSFYDISCIIEDYWEEL